MFKRIIRGQGQRVAVAVFACLTLLALTWAAPSARAADSIYWSTEGGAIQVGNLDGSGSPTTLFSGESSPQGVAIDPASNRIYWGNFDSIRVGNLDGSGSAANVFGGQANPSGVAIDPAANKIYWGDTINAVRVGNLDGSGAPTNLFTEPDLGGGIEGQPLGVAIDPAANRIYWTDFAPYLIRVGNLDGSGSATTLFGAGSNPRGVAIDTAAGKIYWANSDREIRVGNLDGSGSPATLFGEFALGVAIDPAANKIYWGNGDDLRVGNLDGSGSAATLFAGVGAAWPAVLRSPSQTSGTPTAGEDPKCKKLRKKLKRQKKGLAKASTEAKRGMIQDNIEDTKKRLQKLGC